MAPSRARCRRLMVPWEILVLSLWARQTMAQVTDAVCLPSFSWSFNNFSQSPCVVFSTIVASCISSPVNVAALNPGNLYPGATSTDPSAFGLNRCLSSSTLYNIISACSDCQDRPFTSFASFTQNCNYSFTGDFLGPRLNLPIPVPPTTSIPPWAFQDFRHGTWDESLSFINATLTAQMATMSSDSPLPPPTASSTSLPPSSGGGLSGGTIAGIALGATATAIGILILFILLHRRRHRMGGLRESWNRWSDRWSGGRPRPTAQDAEDVVDDLLGSRRNGSGGGGGRSPYGRGREEMRQVQPGLPTTTVSPSASGFFHTSPPPDSSTFRSPPPFNQYRLQASPPSSYQIPRPPPNPNMPPPVIMVTNTPPPRQHDSVTPVDTDTTDVVSYYSDEDTPMRSARPSIYSNEGGERSWEAFQYPDMPSPRLDPRPPITLPAQRGRNPMPDVPEEVSERTSFITQTSMETNWGSGDEREGQGGDREAARLRLQGVSEPRLRANQFPTPPRR
ncbi:hypothetical protein BT69DRAFT_1282837 [Atractiella rhizophila]|nr:hypothetical protein BT69DRAFT_1282837 [Atractiella rhizophila]